VRGVSKLEFSNPAGQKCEGEIKPGSSISCQAFRQQQERNLWLLVIILPELQFADGTANHSCFF